MSKKLCGLMLVLVMLGVLTAGCGQKSEEKKANSDGKETIAVVCKALNSDYWKLVETGAKEAGKKLGIDVKVVGPNAETDVTQQIAMIEDQITNKVSALCIAPSQPDSAISVLNKAKSANIPVFLIDTDVAWNDKVSFIGTGNYEGGKQAGEYLAKILPKGAKIAILRGMLGDPVHDERAKGCEDALKAAGIEVVAIQPANSQREMAMTVTENIIQSGKTFDAVFATNDEMALGSCKALEARKKDIPVVGFDGSPDALKSIQEGKLNASVAQSAYNIGYKSVEAAHNFLKGEKVEKRIDTGTEIINKENVEKQIEQLKKWLGQ